MISDAAAIARVHVQSWRETYAGLVPEHEFAKRPLDVRERQWREWLTAGENDIFVGGEPVAGFASCGAPRPPLPAASELHAIYVLRTAQRQGLGRALFAACGDAMRARGHATMGLWVLAANPSVVFYERLGGRVVAARVDEMGLDERAYAFDLVEPSRR